VIAVLAFHAAPRPVGSRFFLFAASAAAIHSQMCNIADCSPPEYDWAYRLTSKKSQRGMEPMRRAALINPFDLMPPVPRSIDERTVRATPVCSDCGTDDIECHANIQWSNESQEWQLTGTFGKPAHCNNCDAACDVRWVTLN
jgi:hypothetical protein